MRDDDGVREGGVRAVVPATDDGVAILADVARAVAERAGGGGAIAALAVGLVGAEARGRLTVNAATAELALEAARRGTELVVTVHDTGEPISGASTAVLGLVDLGLLTAAVGGPDHVGDAVVGNRTEVRIPLPSHHALLDPDDLEVVDPEAPRSEAPVELRALEPGDAAALTRCIYRCYGWTYPGADHYYPERIAAAIADGRRVGEVAVTADGEIASHWGAAVVADGVVETGATVTDPRFRGRGLANQLGDRLLERLLADGVHGRLREPVLTHPATQHIALREGAAMVGAHLHAVAPLQQVGITDGVQTSRTSLTVMYGPLRPLEPAELWIPAPYRAIVATVLDGADWPRTMGEVRTVDDVPEATVIGSAYDALNCVGSVTVSTVGADLTDAVDEVLGQLRRAGAEMILVHLPANQPALATVGAGLGSLRLGYASLVPAFGSLGDALVLQWLADTDVDTAGWAYADDHVEHIVGLVSEQIRALGDEEVRDRRRRARRQQLLAALPTDD